MSKNEGKKKFSTRGDNRTKMTTPQVRQPKYRKRVEVDKAKVVAKFDYRKGSEYDKADIGFAMLTFNRGSQ